MKMLAIKQAAPIVLGVFTLMFSASSFCADGLLELYREAQLHDTALAAAKADVEASKESKEQSQAMFLPSIGLSASVSHVDMNVPVPGKSSYVYTSDNVSVTLRQQIYRKLNKVANKQSEFRIKAVETMYAQAQQDLIVRVSVAYFDLLRAQDTQRLLESQQAAIAEQLNQSKKLFAAKVGTLTDLNDAQAQADMILSKVIEAKSAVELRSRALQRIIGRRPSNIKSLGDIPLQMPSPEDVEKWIKLSEENNPQIEVKRVNLDYIEQEVEKGRSGHYPTLDAVLSVSRADNPSYFLTGRQDSKSGGLEFNMPLFDGGYVSSRVRELMANKEKAYSDLEDTIRGVALQTSESFFLVTSAIARVKALEQAVISNQSSVQSTTKGKEVGMRTVVDVLSAQQQLFSSMRDLVQARYDYVVNKLKLDSAVGDLSEEKLLAVNRWLK